MAPGQIVVLNGAPRAGKSSIVRAIQATAPGLWLNLGVDIWNAATPPALFPGIGLRPGGERPDLEPAIVALYAGLYHCVAATARQGLNVVVDVGHHDSYARPLGILPASARILAGLPVLFVGVYCPIEVIMARRNAAPEGYLAGSEVPAPVQRWQDAVHQPGLYDLRVDTAENSPEQCAAHILAAVATGVSRPTAFEQLAAMAP